MASGKVLTFDIANNTFRSPSTAGTHHLSANFSRDDAQAFNFTGAATYGCQFNLVRDGKIRYLEIVGGPAVAGVNTTLLTAAGFLSAGDRASLAGSDLPISQVVSLTDNSLEVFGTIRLEPSGGDITLGVGPNGAVFTNTGNIGITIGRTIVMTWTVA